MGSTTAGALRIEVLGRFEVRAGDEVIEAGPLKQRSLLALLALHPATVVSREEIVDTLWGDEPPASCHNLVHTYVSRLRRLLGPALVSSARGGYVLSTDPDGLDLLRFDELADQARHQPPERALPLLEQALRLWRGPVLADLPNSLRQHPAAAAAAGRRLAAALAYGDAALPAGRAATAVELLRAVGYDEPLHEGLHARLMLALAGSGQQAAAFQLFATIRDRLAAELGVEPGAEITAAHERVIRQDVPGTGTEPVTARPAQLPADVSGFAGRAEHLSRLDALVRDAGGTVVLSISGTAGVGKTALAVHWAHRARDRFPDGQLYANLRAYAPDRPMRPMEALTRFLRALGVPPERLPTDEDEAEGLYRTLLAGRRVLVVLDNAADADQVRRLLPGSPGCAALVTSRDRLAGLMATDGAHLLGIDVLDETEAQALLAGMLGEDRLRAERAAVDELARTCAYLPLALRIAAANLSTQPHTSVAAYTATLRERGRLTELAVEGDPRAAVRIAFDLSYARLDDVERRLFRLLGLVPGADFTAGPAAALIESPVARARALLSRLVRGSLLSEHTAGRYQFHDLLREYAASQAAAEESDEDRHAALTRWFDHMLGTADAASWLLDPNGPRGLPPSGVPVPSGAPADEPAAMEWLDVERANLVALATCRDQRLRHYSWRLADLLRGYFTWRGHSPDGLTICTAALEAAMLAADVQAQAAVHSVLGVIYFNLSRYADAITHHERALALHRSGGSPSGEELALHSLGRAYSQLGRPSTAARYHEEALELSRRIGSPHGEAMALNYVGVTALSLGKIDKALRYCTNAHELSREIDDREVALRSLHAVALANWARGDLAAAREILVSHRKRCERSGLRHGLAASTISLAEATCDTGDYPEARAQAQAGIQLGRELGERRHEVGGLEILGTVSLRTGATGAAIRYYTEALQLARTISFGYGETSVLIGLAAARRGAGRPADAIADCRQALDMMRETGMRLLESRAYTELAHCELDTGDRNRAASDAECALALARERGQQLAEGRALLVLGLARRDSPAGAGLLRDALKIFDAAGTPEAAVVRDLLRRPGQP